MNTGTKKGMPREQSEALLSTLQARFTKNINRHKNVDWASVESTLRASSDKLWSLIEMERTGGEPDVVGFHPKTNEYIFYDCAAESPKGRRSLCYDLAAWTSRKEHKPDSSAMEVAAEMGISLLNETQYRELQQLGPFDTKTSSWIATPADIREKGGAVFCDHRYGHVFLYHNGAESYYASRGFRGVLKV